MKTRSESKRKAVKEEEKDNNKKAKVTFDEGTSESGIGESSDGNQYEEQERIPNALDDKSTPSPSEVERDLEMNEILTQLKNKGVLVYKGLPMRIRAVQHLLASPNYSSDTPLLDMMQDILPTSPEMPIINTNGFLQQMFDDLRPFLSCLIDDVAAIKFMVQARLRAEVKNETLQDSFTEDIALGLTLLRSADEMVTKELQEWANYNSARSEMTLRVSPQIASSIMAVQDLDQKQILQLRSLANGLLEMYLAIEEIIGQVLEGMENIGRVANLYKRIYS